MNTYSVRVFFACYSSMNRCSVAYFFWLLLVNKCLFSCPSLSSWTIIQLEFFVSSSVLMNTYSVTYFCSLLYAYESLFSCPSLSSWIAIHLHLFIACYSSMNTYSSTHFSFINLPTFFHNLLHFFLKSYPQILITNDRSP